MGLNNDIRFYFLNYDFGENLSAVEMASFLRAQCVLSIGNASK